MDSANRYQRPPGLPSGPASGMRPTQRGPPSSSLSPPPSGPPGQMTRAERFEDEKRRIMESCFSKFDETGQLAESYITHIRITEDSSYPQTPHPPDSPSANKERIIMVAVRNTGRVRLHKAKENGNKSFSIGKTWSLEDLSAVQSWASYKPRNDEETLFKKWAGDIGFTVTIAKPYYWQAGTAKEKEFFIASLVKIYRKYTQGRIPELIGFTPREVEQMLGQQGPQVRSPSATSPGGGPPQLPPFSPGRGLGFGDGLKSMDRNGTPLSSAGSGFATPQTPDSLANQSLPPYRNRPPNASSSQERPGLQQQRSPSQSQTPPPGGLYPQDPMRQPRPRPSREAELRQPPSREQMRPIGTTPSGRLTPQSQSSRSDMAPPRDGTPDSLQIRAPRQPSGNSPERRSPSRTRDDEQFTPNALGISAPSSDRRRPNGAPVERDGERNGLPRAPNGFAGTNGSQDSLADPAAAAVPERRRPFMIGAQPNGSQSSLARGPQNQTAGPPILSPRGGGFMPGAAASTESLPRDKQERMPGGFNYSPAPSSDIEREGLLPAPLQPSPKPKQEEIKSTPEPPKSEPEPAPAVRAPSPQPEPSKSQQSEEEQKKAEAARPGLGRMFGGSNRSAKEMFKSAANAYGAFVPRAGGAAARIRASETKEAGEPDGISGVVPAPGLLRTRTDDSMKSETQKDDSSIQATPTSAKATPVDTYPTEPVPQVTISSPISPPNEDAEKVLPLPPPEEQASNAAAAAQQKKSKLAEEEAARRKKRRSQQQMKYLSKLGVDSTVLENRGLEFESLLNDFDWGTPASQSRNIDALEADIRREISRVEAGSWLGHLEQKDDRVEAVEKLLDRAIAEVDDLEGLLTLYSVELSSLNDDIAFIEAQSQGLQVQTANQKLLQTELQNLVDTISITSRQLEPLKRASPNNTEGLVAIEQALLMLYKAMVTIDPTIRQNGTAPTNQTTSLANTELSSMVALQEKSDQYLGESSMFLKRFTQFMDMTFGAAMLDAKDLIQRQISGSSQNNKLSAEVHDAARSSLWQYSPLLLFAKEIDKQSWDTLLRMYQSRARALYQEEFRDNVQIWKRLARNQSGDEQELLFTFHEKEVEGLSGTARKLTVKRSQTLARGLRNASGEKPRSNTIQSGTLYPFEAFSGALDEMTPLISIEQNFIVEFFHATGTESIDFADAVTAAPPEARRGTNLHIRRAFEPDRDMARRVVEAMDDVYSFFPAELQSLIEWAIKAEPLQGIGIMHALHRNVVNFEDTNQDFLTKTLTTIATRLSGLWNKFVEEQIRAIEDTKVKIKKRKGVIGFIKIFPNFSAAIENMLPSAADEPAETSEVRSMIDQAYRRINKAMFEALRVIAKESPAMTVGGNPIGGGGADPEDKEALNYHILLIENMNHYVEEVDERGDRVLEEGRREAKEEMGEHLNMYVDAVIRRPLGKVIDFIETLDHTLSTINPGTPPSAIATRPSTSRSVFRKLLSSHDPKELRRGIEALRKRIDKHFGDSDDPNLCRDLMGKVLQACEAAYCDVFRRVQDYGREVYEGEEGPAVLGTREEVGRWFRGQR